MATVNGFTANHMRDVENATVVSGSVDAQGILVLMTKGGTAVKAGKVVGPKGDPGSPGSPGSPGTPGAPGSPVDVSRPWDSLTAYVTGDVVGYAGQLWKATKDNTNLPPALNTSAWKSVLGFHSQEWAQIDPYFAGDDFTKAWETYWHSNSSTVSRTTAAGNFEAGIGALQIDLGLNSSQWLYERVENIIDGGDRIVVKVRARTTTSVPGLHFDMSLFQNDKTGPPGPLESGYVQTNSRDGAVTPTTEWKTYTFVVNAVNGKPRARAGISIFTDASTQGTLLIDSVRITKMRDNGDMLLRQTRMYQRLLTGGGRRKTNSTGVGWTTRFMLMGNGRADFAPDGYFAIDMPADGTVISQLGSTAANSVTVSGGIIPLKAWAALYYELPLSGSYGSQSGRFRIVDYSATLYDIPPSWVLIAVKNADSLSGPTYTWGDGVRQDYWRTPTMLNGWTAYATTNWSGPAWRFDADGRIRLRGLIKGGTVGTSTPVFKLDPSLGPDSDGTGNYGIISIQNSAGGTCRVDVYQDGNVAVNALFSGTSAAISLDGINWYPKGM